MRVSMSPRRVCAQALVELALLMPMLALLFVGLIELSFLLHAHVQISSAAREAARAASLYRSTRYATLDTLNPGHPTDCGQGSGWSLQQTVEQAVVRRVLANKGCPSTTGEISFSALGRLNPTPTPSNWTVTISPTFVQHDTDMPTPGTSAAIELRYPYQLILATELFHWGTPLWISKAVVFEYQQ